MAITLAPALNTLGITAPVLGPWFSVNTVNLPALTASQNLGLTLNFGAATDWYAPATGTLSLFITNGANPPAALDALQDSAGLWPFPNNRIVAYFRLFPEIEARLHELMGLVPAADAAAVGAPPTTLAAPTRPQVRSFAMVLPLAGPTFVPADLYPFFGGQANVPGSNDAERMAALGLALDNAGHIANGPVPMTWLRRPGGSVADRDKLLVGLNGNVDLWAFDRRGRAIDPGAVACWWSWLLNTAVGDDPATPASDIQLLAPSITAANYPQQGGQPVVVQFAAQQTLHLVDAHEGPLGAPFLNDRLQSNGSTVSANVITLTGTGPSLSFSALTPPGTTPPADNPQLDNAPRARLAVLPAGTYGTTAQPWPNGPVHAGLTRDFVRVAVVEEESHLTGLTRRDSRLAAATPADRRQSAQNRPSTRIHVNRTNNTAGVLLANSQATADALLALPNAAAPTRMVLNLADVAWGGTPGAAASGPAAGPGPLPALLSDAGNSAPTAGQYRVQALTGGGTASESFQSVLLQIELGAVNAGAWVRAWPLGFDLSRGEHMRLSGGAGRADTNGRVLLVMLLPNGLVASMGLLGMDLLVLLPGPSNTIAAQRHYADRRFARPAPAGGTAATTVSGTWAVCEAGITGNGAMPNGSVPAGGHVVLLTSPPTLVDRTSLPAAAWDNNALLNRIQATTDIVSLTEPAFDAAPNRADVTGRPLPRTPTTGGDPRGGLNGLIGNRLHLLSRGPLVGATASSVPYALMDRLEVAAATVPAAGAQAVIGTSPAAPWNLSPTANFYLGFVGVPAGVESHGTGVALTGSPAVAVAEYVRERTAGLSFGFVQGLTEPARSAAIQSELAVAAEAATPLLPAPTDGAGAGPVVAVLRTSALGMEGLPGVAEGTMASASLFPFSQNELALESWLDSQISLAGGAGAQLRNAVGGNIDAITRALDRRLWTSAFGAREALISLLAAIDRAQDFIYIETPWLDNLGIDSGGENLQWWMRLVNRMSNRKGLRVALCVPTRLTPGTPKMLHDVRNHCLLDAIATLRNAQPDRFAVFSPGVGAGRALRLTSSTVVIDDAWALTGTTHLSRRGLSWDSSLAACVFDERLTDGRPTDVRAFRMQLMADRLGLPLTRLPSDPAELVKAIRDFDTRGSDKLSVQPILRPTDTPANGDIDIWNPDGSQSGLSLTSIATLFASAVALTDTDHAVVDG